MSKTNWLENAWLDLFFNNIDMPGIGGTPSVPLPLRGATTAGAMYVSLHVGDPGEGGTQSTSEISYGNYARYGINRGAGKFVVVGGTMSFSVDLVFNAATSGGGTVTHFGIGQSAFTAGQLYYYGPVTPSVVVSTGVTPILLAASSVTED